MSLDTHLGMVGKRRSDGVSQYGNYLSYSEPQAGPVRRRAASPGPVKPGTGVLCQGAAIMDLDVVRTP